MERLKEAILLTVCIAFGWGSEGRLLVEIRVMLFGGGGGLLGKVSSH